MKRGLEHLLYQERVRDLELFREENGERASHRCL